MEIKAHYARPRAPDDLGGFALAGRALVGRDLGDDFPRKRELGTKEAAKTVKEPTIFHRVVEGDISWALIGRGHCVLFGRRVKIW